MKDKKTAGIRWIPAVQTVKKVRNRQNKLTFKKIGCGFEKNK